MAPSLLTFPNPVNDVAARAVASGVVVMSSLALATHAMWITIPLAYGFVARLASGPRFSPLGRTATMLIAPRLERYTKLVPGPPKRFAQGIGAIFTVSALILWLVGDITASRILLAVLIVPSLLEAALGFCVGCKMFAFLMRYGIISEEICEECSDIFSEKARARRAAHASRDA
ncbi:MAG TPA: DUF4395 domain-containing protein [Acidimicrobiales bacterium]|nr:DUF4395 domain-containing protein [Acidimicrobiales bacterium]